MVALQAPFTMRDIIKNISLLHLAILILGVIGVALFTWGTANFGIGISTDSVAYLSAAEGLLAGEGYLTYLDEPMVRWPPLFPTLIAGFGLFGIAPVIAAEIINSLAFGMIVLTSGLLFHRCLRSPVLVVLGTTSVLFSWPILSVSMFALTEPLFVLLIILYLLVVCEYLKSGAFPILVAAAVLVMLAWLQRLAGLAIMAAGLASIAIFVRHGTLLGRGRNLIIFSAISATPIALWLTRNFLLSSPLGGKVSSSTSLWQNLSDTFHFIGLWFHLSPTFYLTFFSFSLVLIVPLSLLVIRGDIWTKGPPRRSLILSSAGILFVGYLTFLIGAGSVINVGPIGDRLLAPLYVIAMLFVVVGLEELSEGLGRLWRHLPGFARQRKSLGWSLTVVGILSNEWVLSEMVSFLGPMESGERLRLVLFQIICIAVGMILVAPRRLDVKRHLGRVIVISFFAMWLTYPAEITITRVNLLNQNGAGGFSTSIWKGSPIVDWLSRNSLEDQIYTNDRAALYFLSSVESLDFRELPANLSDLQGGDALVNDVFLIWFRVPGWNEELHDFNGQEFSSIFETKAVVSYPQGGIYELGLRCGIVNQLAPSREKDSQSANFADGERIRISIALSNVLGPSASFIPVGNGNIDERSPRGFESTGSPPASFIWSKAPADFRVDLTGSSCHKGVVPLVEMNGIDESAETRDSAFWTAANESGDEAFSVGLWVSPDGSQTMPLLSKAGPTAREWEVMLFNANRPSLLLWDADPSIAVNRRVSPDYAIPPKAWSFLVVTYDGTGGSSAMERTKWYIDGQLVESTQSNDSAYVGMRSGESPLGIGVRSGTSQHYAGRMAGGPIGPFFVKRVISDDDILRIYEIGNEALGLE